MEEQQIEKKHGTSVSVKINPPLPCTSEDCPNLATVASASYDAHENGWLIFPLCQACTERLMRQYEEGH